MSRSKKHFSVVDSLLTQHKLLRVKYNPVPWPSFNIEAVIKTDKTFLNVSDEKIAVGSPEPFQATIIIA